MHVATMQAANAKQAARHTKEVDELLLELSRQHAASQAALAQGQGASGQDASLQGAMQQGIPQQGALQQGMSSSTGQLLQADSAQMKINAMTEGGADSNNSLTQQPPRLTTPVSPSRRPNTHFRGVHIPPMTPPADTRPEPSPPQ